jgi:hypothetical protein
MKNEIWADILMLHIILRLITLRCRFMSASQMKVYRLIIFNIPYPNPLNPYSPTRNVFVTRSRWIQLANNKRSTTWRAVAHHYVFSQVSHKLRPHANCSLLTNDTLHWNLTILNRHNTSKLLLACSHRALCWPSALNTEFRSLLSSLTVFSALSVILHSFRYNAIFSPIKYLLLRLQKVWFFLMFNQASYDILLTADCRYVQLLKLTCYKKAWYIFYYISYSNPSTNTWIPFIKPTNLLIRMFRVCWSTALLTGQDV